MTLLQSWVRYCEVLGQATAYQYCGCRKILRDVGFVVDGLDQSLQMKHVGYTPSKMRQLERNYLNEPSIDAALKLWDKRLKTRKYGSVGITGYNHFMKGDIKGATPRGSVMGPCIQSILLTQYNGKKGCYTNIDVLYRTTEFFKKFPADVVFIRDKILNRFDFTVAPIDLVSFHFINVTIHPMYWIAVAGNLKDPLLQLEAIRRRDPRLWEWIVKWTGRYLIPEYGNGIEKFAQAMRVKETGVDNLTSSVAHRLRLYCRDNWPGVKHRRKTS